jgi:cytochrome c oxidase subunit 2
MRGIPGRVGATLILLCLLALAGCQDVQVQSTLKPAGPPAERIAELWWIMLIIAVTVFVIVLILLLIAIFKRRQAAETSAPGGVTFIILGGIAIPAVILIGLLVYTLGVVAALEPPSEDALTVEVIGHQWWWEVRYPGREFVTANQIHVPAGERVRLELTSADVIHSFWVPQLNGKIDLIPGQWNTFWIEATEPGIYRGQCAEYCGTQHAKMALLVVADPPEVFDAWLDDQQREAAVLTDPLLIRGQQVFLGSVCVYCHTVRGTNASGKIGPDLTHLASRYTLGAGIIANNRGNLGGWIINSQAIKPGNRMPPMYLDSEELQALLSYLESLE